jgi:hypothetical protein
MQQVKCEGSNGPGALLQKERSEKFIFNLETQAVELKGLS